MKEFTVKALSELSGVTVRTLHHYDAIGLLRPGLRKENNYRYYSEAELLRLQQILLYRELGFTLKMIAKILDDPEFDMIKALQEQRRILHERLRKTGDIISSVDYTLKQLKMKNKKMDHNELYRGLSRQQGEAYREEAREKYGKEIVDDSYNRLLAMNVNEFNDLKALGEQIAIELASLTHLEPSDSKVQYLIRKHYEMTGRYFAVTPEIYLHLGRMYVDDRRFTVYYDRFKKGLAVFVRDAIEVFVNKPGT